MPYSSPSLLEWEAKARDLWKPENQYESGFSYALQFLLAFALYFAVGRLGLAVPFTSANVSPIWPAAGVAVALLLLWGIRIAPAIAFAAFLVNYLSAIPALAAVGMGVGNASSAVAAAYLLKHLSGFQIPLSRLRDVLRLVMFGAVLPTNIAAFIGVSALVLSHTRAWSGYASAWRIWWLGDAMGVVIAAPLVLNGRDLLRLCRGWRVLELCLVCLAVLGVSSAIFGPWAAVRDDVLALVVFPFVVWAAIRFRVAGAALASLLVASVAVWGTLRGFGPFVNHSPLHNAVLLQIFIAVSALTGLVLAAVISEREDLPGARRGTHPRTGTKDRTISERVPSCWTWQMVPFSSAMPRAELPTGARVPSDSMAGGRKKPSAERLTSCFTRNSRLMSLRFLRWIAGKANFTRSVEMGCRLWLRAVGPRCGIIRARPWVGWKSIPTSLPGPGRSSHSKPQSSNVELGSR